jgi:hypothetical protein
MSLKTPARAAPSVQAGFFRLLIYQHSTGAGVDISAWRRRQLLLYHHLFVFMFNKFNKNNVLKNWHQLCCVRDVRRFLKVRSLFVPGSRACVRWFHAR